MDHDCGQLAGVTLFGRKRFTRNHPWLLSRILFQSHYLGGVIAFPVTHSELSFESSRVM